MPELTLDQRVTNLEKALASLGGLVAEGEHDAGKAYKSWLALQTPPAQPEPQSAPAPQPDPAPAAPPQ